MNNKEIEERYINLIEDNVNVGKTNAGVEFIILLSGILGLFIVLFFCVDSIASVYIDNMSNESKEVVESLISTSPDTKKLVENKVAVAKLDAIKKKVIEQDKTLQTGAKFPIQIMESEYINAVIVPDGSIYITTELLKQNYSDEILTFIIAHELAHYAHRDGLKLFSRYVISAALKGLFAAGSSGHTDIVINNYDLISGFSYSRRQETSADVYATLAVKKIYGSAAGAENFFQELLKKENSFEFLEYFSTHPSTQKRLRTIQRYK